jgi:hypothetical protein
VLAIDPFLLGATVLGAIAYRCRFRVYTVTTIIVTSILAISKFWYVPEFIANRRTPWMGAFERSSQYGTNLWHAFLAVMTLRRDPRRPRRPHAQWRVAAT